jgi:hypothetical protein
LDIAHRYNFLRSNVFENQLCLNLSRKLFLFSFDDEDRAGFLKRRGRVVNTPASYLGGLGPETGYSDLGFCGFPQFLQANAGIVP